MRTILSASLALALLGGCATQFSETPLAINFPTDKQHKLQAGSHWGLIAANVAEQIKTSVAKDSTLYVVPARLQTDFNRAFHNQLVSALVNQGLSVTKSYDSQALLVDIDTQLVNFSPDRFQNRRFVSATAITAGLLAVNGVVSGSDAAAVGALGIAAAIDWDQLVNQEFARGRTPSHELIVTTSASRNSQYIARRTDVYYISDTDSRLYQNLTRNFPVRGDQ